MILDVIPEIKRQDMVELNKFFRQCGGTSDPTSDAIIFAYEHEKENRMKQEYARSSVYPWQCQPDFNEGCL